MFSKKTSRANNPVSKTLIWVVLAAILFSTACTTSRVIKAQPSAVKSELKIGNPARITTENRSNVVITTKDGSNFEFRIVDVSSEGVIGYKLRNRIHGVPQRTIPFSDIANLHPQRLNRVSPADVVTVVSVVVGVVVVVWLIWFLVTLDKEFDKLATER